MPLHSSLNHCLGIGHRLAVCRTAAQLAPDFGRLKNGNERNEMNERERGGGGKKKKKKKKKRKEKMKKKKGGGRQNVVA